MSFQHFIIQIKNTPKFQRKLMLEKNNYPVFILSQVFRFKGLQPKNYIYFTFSCKFLFTESKENILKVLSHRVFLHNICIQFHKTQNFPFQTDNYQCSLISLRIYSRMKQEFVYHPIHGTSTSETIYSYANILENEHWTITPYWTIALDHNSITSPQRG